MSSLPVRPLLPATRVALLDLQPRPVLRHPRDNTMQCCSDLSEDVSLLTSARAMLW